MKDIRSILHSSKSVEWYTSPEVCDIVRASLGGHIELDPASNFIANMTVRAERWFDEWDNGQKLAWEADTLFHNPPYGKDEDTNKSNAAIWTNKMLDEFDLENFGQGILLVNAVPDRSWFKPLWNHWICFLDTRVKFWTSSGKANQPTNGNALIYMGEKPDGFIKNASMIGTVIDPDHVYCSDILI